MAEFFEHFSPNLAEIFERRQLGVRARPSDMAHSVQCASCDLEYSSWLEAVGKEYWGEFFRTCDRLLVKGGLIGLQVITVADQDFEDHARQSHWVQKYIFPGGLLPSLLELMRAMAASSSLGVYHLEDIGEHYATTLAHWRFAFRRRLAEVRALGFDERFIRMWDFYLAACEARFSTRTQHTLQLVLARPGSISS